MPDFKENAVILIPANKMTEGLFELCSALADFPVLCVDAGGDGLSPLPSNVTVISPDSVKGRGGALAAGLRYIGEGDTYAHCGYVVTAEEGSRAEDIVRLAREARETGGVVLGSRSTAGVSAVRRFGRKFTDLVFRIAAGKAVSDPMTGLCAMPKETAVQLAELPGERFEFEINRLFAVLEDGAAICEIPVGASSGGFRFHPVADTVRLYWSIFLGSRSLKYLFSSGLAFIIDYVLLVAIARLLAFDGAVELVAAPAAWIVSSLTNFFLNRNFVFRSNTPLLVALPEYYGLAGIVFLLKTYVLLELMVRVIGMPLEIAKLVAEVVFFVSNYFIQKKFIFKKKK
ncbi:MAG: hypothetical protein E7638_05035 [Ruminococcaceae bacterium]|nr:hypothetical protein [Oscillospiraceae bacterium]